MSAFQLSSLRNSSVWGLYRLKERVEMNPVYQRESGIWSRDQEQLLIDTIVNQFDVPKIYLHKFSQAVERENATYEYAVIDGKQRLTAIWAFIDGAFALATDFKYLKNEQGGQQVDAGGLTYADLARKYPDVKTDFDSYALDVVCIETEDLELIDELFSRLNEAVPLSAPEKRNALPGPLPEAVRMIAEHDFFTKKLPFSNRRYRHYDLIAKMLLNVAANEVSDTKKAYLDNFFDISKNLDKQKVTDYTTEIVNILDWMNAVFIDGDPLLRQIGMTVLYFHVFRRAIHTQLLELLNRDAFLKFDEGRKENRTAAAREIALADYRLLEFDRFTQSPNDAYAMRIRLAVFDEKVFDGKLGFPPILQEK